ncbi:hypothetical protein D3C78_1608000 [compost metagenome]
MSASAKPASLPNSGGIRRDKTSDGGSVVLFHQVRSHGQLQGLAGATAAAAPEPDAQQQHEKPDRQDDCRTHWCGIQLAQCGRAAQQAGGAGHGQQYTECCQ